MATETKAQIAAELAAVKAALAAANGTVTNGTAVPNTDAASAKINLATQDRALLDKIVAKHGKDNGHGPSTGNVHWSVKKPAGVVGPMVVTIATADGARNVPATLMVLVGAMMGVTDFKLSDSASGATKVWTSQQAAKRIADAGYTLTKRSKIWLPNKADGAGRSTAVATVVDPSSFL